MVRVSRTADEDSDDLEEEDTGYGGRGLSSRVSLPSKPERKSVFKPQYNIWEHSVVYIVEFVKAQGTNLKLAATDVLCWALTLLCFVCLFQTYSPSSQASQQESDTEGYL